MNRLRHNGLVAPVLLALVPHAPLAQPAQAPAGPAQDCDLRAPNYESKEVTCWLDTSKGARAFRFVASFTGGHDDTIAEIKLALDGQPLRCEEGSKARLTGEDGEISLNCGFALAERPRLAELKATVTWSHAEYAGYMLVRVAAP